MDTEFVGRRRSGAVDSSGQNQPDLASTADPSWHAWQGYRSATCGRASTGHLAWERISGRFVGARRAALARGGVFDDQRVAYVMGYGLGLRDMRSSESGSEAEVPDTVDVVLPWISSPPIANNGPRFWLSVCG
ncbi:MAG: hypothetical protein ACI9WU_005165 [Myxococcota bacterium]|jgi:hypothetical protein